jgi:transcriptional regulator with XRE-family HTH domain
MARMPRATIDPSLGPVLRRLRLERELSQETLAHLSGLTVATYINIELGRSAPGWSTVRRIAEALGVPLGELAAAVEAET